jgi:hypothetical protein
MYCLVLPCSTVGYRSGLYAQELQEQGIQAANLIGGICAWVSAGERLGFGSRSDLNPKLIGGICAWVGAGSV